MKSDLGLVAETWISASSFPDYEVSSAGRVRRLTTRTNTKAGRVLKPARHYRGYLQHGLGRDGKTVTVRLNRLICESFHGAAPTPRHEAAHWNGDKLDNHAANLRWATKLENADDKQRHGTTARGEPHAWKLNDAAVRAIREKAGAKTRYDTIAAEFGISKGMVDHIVRRRSWAHVL